MPSTIGSVYQPPLVLIIFASAAIAVLVISALGPRPALRPAQGTTRVPPQPWLAGLLVFVLSLLWFGLVAFAYDVNPKDPCHGSYHTRSHPGWHGSFLDKNALYVH